ncbi:MAG: hypothetical protein V7637_1424 [Mycobacteriales bacterium]|jgi:hypothetical protein
MVALTRLLGALVRMFTRTRRMKIALVAVPALVVLVLVGPRAATRNDRAGTPPTLGTGGVATTTITPTATIASPTGLPGTTGPAPGPTVRQRSEPALAKAPADTARAYALTVNTHDARPGKDAGFIDSYVHARPYVSPQLYTLISAPSRRGDYLWAGWVKLHATVTAEVVRVAVPDGAPAPTATSAHVRVQFRQLVTPHVAGARAPAPTLDAVSLVVTRNSDGHWLVTQLLADT